MWVRAAKTDIKENKHSESETPTNDMKQMVQIYSITNFSILIFDPSERETLIRIYVARGGTGNRYTGL